MKKKGIVLLSISLDKNKEDWQKALMSYSFLKVKNIPVTDIRAVMALYQLSTIPEYRILNKKKRVGKSISTLYRDVLVDFEKRLKE